MVNLKWIDSSLDEKDSLFDEAVKITTEFQRASASLLQRRLDIGYTRAARLIDQLYEDGVIGPGEGATPREVIIKSFEEYQKNRDSGTLRRRSLIERNETKSIKVRKDLPVSGKFTKQFPTNSLTILLGTNEEGKQITKKIPELRHLIISGSPLSQKMAFVDNLLLSLLSNNTPDNLRLVVIDPAHYLDLYNDIPHLLTPVVSDYDKITSTFMWTRHELNRRGKLFGEMKVRTIEKYNNVAGSNKLSRILFVINRINDISDLPEARYHLDSFVSYGQEAGIHLILISDRLSSKDLPTNIKTNIPNRIIFKTNSKIDSKLAGVKGAETLEMEEFLFRSQENPSGQKLKATFSSEEDIEELSGWYFCK